MDRTVVNQVTGFRTQDGAGVSLVRVLGSTTVREYDPILMLDSFDSDDPDAYTAGFPMHPHRGIETISYVYEGAMTHRDSLGNEDTIADGEVQWMTAGSGILHEEMLPASPHLLGVQLWLNLPRADKMVPPAYHSIKRQSIPEVAFEGGYLRVLAGRYDDVEGHQGAYLPLDYYDIHLETGASLTLQTAPERSALVFTLKGNALVGATPVKEKTAAKLSNGTSVTIESQAGPAQVLFMSSTALDEPVAWNGPIVMNTNAELEEAFDDLQNGTFLRQGMSYDEQ